MRLSLTPWYLPLKSVWGQFVDYGVGATSAVRNRVLYPRCLTSVAGAVADGSAVEADHTTVAVRVQAINE